MTRRGYVNILLLHYLSDKDSCNAKRMHKYMLKLLKFNAGVINDAWDLLYGPVSNERAQHGIGNIKLVVVVLQ